MEFLDARRLTGPNLLWNRPGSILDVACSEDEARRTQLAQGGIAPTPQFLFPGPDDPKCTGADCAPPPIGCIGVECFDPGFTNNPVRTLWTQNGIE